MVYLIGGRHCLIPHHVSNKYIYSYPTQHIYFSDKFELWKYRYIFTSFVSNSVIFAEFVNPTPVNSKTNCCILKLLKFCTDAIKHALPSYAVVIATGSELLDSCIVISFTCDCLDSFKAFPFSQSK